MSWLAARRRHRLERDTEQRLRRALEKAPKDRPFFIHGRFVPVLGRVRVNSIVAEYGLPAVHEERAAA